MNRLAYYYLLISGNGACVQSLNMYRRRDVAVRIGEGMAKHLAKLSRSAVELVVVNALTNEAIHNQYFYHLKVIEGGKKQ